MSIMWLLISLIGYAAAAVVSILDKFILTNEKVSPLKFVFYSTVFIAPLFLLAPWVPAPQGFVNWLAAILTGFCFAGGLWTMYLGIAKSEISHIGPLIGGAIPLFILLFSYLFLGELISTQQLVAIFLLALGSLLIASEYTGRRQELRGAIGWGLVAAILFAISHVASKYLYNEIGFSGGLVWGRSFTGLFGLIILAVPATWKYIFTPRRFHILKQKKSFVAITLIALDKILAVASLLLIQYAIFLGSVTIVNALAGVQYAFLLILVGVMSKFFPKRFREEYSRAEIIQEIISVLVISLGLILLL